MPRAAAFVVNKLHVGTRADKVDIAVIYPAAIARRNYANHRRVPFYFYVRRGGGGGRFLFSFYAEASEEIGRDDFAAPFFNPDVYRTTQVQLERITPL
jgi:hypothetical protein